MTTTTAPLQGDTDPVQELRQHGFCLLPGLARGSALAALAHRLPRSREYDPGVGTDKSRAATLCFLRHGDSARAVRDLVGEPRLAWLLSHFHARPSIEHSKLLVKAPGGLSTPWHQDHAFFAPFDPYASMISVWIALSPVTAENGCLQVVPGSHRSAPLPHCKAPGAELELETPPTGPFTDVPLAPGDAVAFSSMLVHRARANRSSEPRFGFKLVYQDLSLRKHGVRPHASAVRMDGARGLFDFYLPCASARVRVARDDARRALFSLRTRQLSATNG